MLSCGLAGSDQVSYLPERISFPHPTKFSDHNVADRFDRAVYKYAPNSDWPFGIAVTIANQSLGNTEFRFVHQAGWDAEPT